MSQHNIELLVQKAREANSKPIPEKVVSEKDGKLLIQAMETYLEEKGFYPFDDIEADANNHFCLKSRKSFRLVGGKHKVYISLRLFKQNDGSMRVFVQVQ